MLRVRTKDGNCFDVLREFSSPEATRNDVAKTVTEIIEDVKRRGDEAVLQYTAKFDRAELTRDQLRISRGVIETAVASIDEGKLSAMKASADSISDFHKRTLPKNWKKRNPHGAFVGELFYPIRRVGIYIPGGQTPLCSTVLMTAIPAKIAGVPEIVLCTPPRADGSVAPEILAAAKLCGLEEIYCVGGVQAIAAMAVGTETISAVDKVAGPGNAFVVEAKRQFFGKVGIDLLPGPSEVMVIADAKSNPEWVATDLITQAEHGSGKEKVYLLTFDERVATAVEDAISSQLTQYKKGERLREIMSVGFCEIIADSVDSAIAVANFIAPEHLEIQTSPKTAKIISSRVTTAGAMLVGAYSPATLGDFAAGPSHTLPTSRTGRFFGGLQVADFMRRTSYVQYDKKSLYTAQPIVSAFSKMENLEVHGHSVDIRFEEKRK